MLQPKGMSFHSNDGGQKKKKVNVFFGCRFFSSYHLSVTSWPHSICPCGCVDTHCVPDIWEQPIQQPPPHLAMPLPSVPMVAEDIGLMGTTYLHPALYQIVDTNRYPCNQNILLLLTLTLALRGPSSLPPLGYQLLCSVCMWEQMLVGVHICWQVHLIINCGIFDITANSVCVCVFGNKVSADQCEIEANSLVWHVSFSTLRTPLVWGVGD